MQRCVVYMCHVPVQDSSEHAFVLQQHKYEEALSGQHAENYMLETQAGPVVPLTTKTVEERFADAQASARHLGVDPSLKWIYDVSDELHGASCGDVTFSREELLQLSRSSCWAGR